MNKQTLINTISTSLYPIFLTMGNIIFFSQVVCNNILPIKCNKMSLVSRKVTVFLEKGPESAATHLFLFALSCFSCPKYTQAIHNQGSQLATM